jgi:hypothetical protein
MIPSVNRVRYMAHMVRCVKLFLQRQKIAPAAPGAAGGLYYGNKKLT